ncbi:uracil-DNA glycosylase [Christensenellaceae bacterium OttesenSCG-928-M15]|nr:uracil-DNA glycosylase [Christensenellaceae bacterium OttesenSCG-928-M15]
MEGKRTLDAYLNDLYAQERERLKVLVGGAHAGMFEQPVFGEGATHPRLLLVGEAPGAEEAASGKPFIGKAGKHLDELLRLSGIDRKDVFITNAVKYRPVTYTKRGMKNRTPTKKEVDKAIDLLKSEILYIRPELIATLGNTPVYALYALSGKKCPTIGEVHGQALPMKIEAFSFTLFPLYHPASTIYNRLLLPVCEADLKRLGELVNNR